MTYPAALSRRAAAAVVAGAALVSTGCGGGEGAVLTAGNATVLVSAPMDEGMDALWFGRLEVVGGCLGIEGVVVVWPPGTEVTGEGPFAIDVPGYGTFAEGDEVEVGGGFVLEHSSGGVAPDPYEVAGVTVPPECGEHDVFLSR